MKKLLFGFFFCFLLCAVAFPQKAEARIVVDCFFQKTPEIKHFLKCFFSSLEKSLKRGKAHLAANQGSVRIVFFGCDRNEEPYVEVLLLYEGEPLFFWETERGDFKDEQTIKEAADWIVWEIISHTIALNTCREAPIKIEPQPWKKHRRRR